MTSRLNANGVAKAWCAGRALIRGLITRSIKLSSDWDLVAGNGIVVQRRFGIGIVFWREVLIDRQTKRRTRTRVNDSEIRMDGRTS